MRVSGRNGDYTLGALENSPVATVGEKGDLTMPMYRGWVDVFSHYHVVIAIMKSQPNSFGSAPALSATTSCLLWQRWPHRHDDLQKLPETYETERNTRKKNEDDANIMTPRLLAVKGKKNSDADILGDGRYQMYGKYRAGILIDCRQPTLN